MVKIDRASVLGVTGLILVAYVLIGDNSSLTSKFPFAASDDFTISQFQGLDAVLRSPVLGHEAKAQAAYDAVFQQDASAITERTSVGGSRAGKRTLPSVLRDRLEIPRPSAATLQSLHLATAQAALHSKVYLQNQLSNHALTIAVEQFTVNDHLYELTFNSGTGQLKTPSGHAFPVETTVIDVLGTDDVQESITIDQAGWPVGLAFGKSFMTQRLFEELF